MMCALLLKQAEVAKETFQEDENAYMRMDGHHLQSGKFKR